MLCKIISVHGCVRMHCKTHSSWFDNLNMFDNLDMLGEHGLVALKIRTVSQHYLTHLRLVDSSTIALWTGCLV